MGCARAWWIGIGWTSRSRFGERQFASWWTTNESWNSETDFRSNYRDSGIPVRQRNTAKPATNAGSRRMKRSTLQEILIFAVSAAVGLTLYDFIVKPALTKTLAGVPPQSPPPQLR